MIKTKIIEVSFDPNNPNRPKEEERGWCYMPEVPVSKIIPAPGEDRPPFIIKVNDVPHYVAGHTWEIETRPEGSAATSVLVLVVQRIPQASSLVRAPANALDEIEAMVPLPGTH